MIYRSRSSRVYGRSEIGENAVISENVLLGYPEENILRGLLREGKKIEEGDFPGVKLGRNCVIRPNSIIYCNVEIGDNLRTGHNILVREGTRIGSNVLIGTNGVIEGDTTIGSYVSIQSNAYIPINTVIEDYVFLGPGATLTNDKYPVRRKPRLKGPRIRRNASLGAGVIVLPGVEVGEGAMIGGGSVVTRDVPPWKIALGVPARVVKDVPREMQGLNRI